MYLDTGAFRCANHYLHNYFSRLRRKLGDSSKLLENVPGMGYILHSRPTEDQRQSNERSK